MIFCTDAAVVVWAAVLSLWQTLSWMVDQQQISLPAARPWFSLSPVQAQEPTLTVSIMMDALWSDRTIFLVIRCNHYCEIRWPMVNHYQYISVYHSHVKHQESISPDGNSLGWCGEWPWGIYHAEFQPPLRSCARCMVENKPSRKSCWHKHTPARHGDCIRHRSRVSGCHSLVNGNHLYQAGFLIRASIPCYW